MLELQMNTAIEELPRELSFNFEELKTELSAQLERYTGIIITEDAIQVGKEDRARLNKLKTAIENRRKEIKKQWNEPYAAFEAKIKEIVAMVDAPIKAIDAQLAAYDDQRKAEKEEKIRDLYHEYVPEDVKGILLFDRIFDHKWYNKGVSLDEIRDTLIVLANRVQNDVEALKVVDPEHAAAVRREYYRTLDLGAAMRCLTELREAAAAIKQAAPIENKPEPEKPAEPIQEPQREPEPAPAEEKLYKLSLEMYLTAKQAEGLKQYLVGNGINFKKI